MIFKSEPVAKPHTQLWLTVFSLVLLLTPLNSQAATLKVSIVNQKGEALSDAVVSFNPIGEAIPDNGNALTSIDQVNKEFVPEVTVVQSGTAINFPNNDDILHHVYSFSESKTFDLPLYKGTPAEPVIFDKPGLVTLGCNIHDWMRAYVVVVDTPYYQLSDESGTVVIENIPVGDYQMEVWHPRQRKVYTKNIYVGIEFSLDVEIATKPQLRSRRHSSNQGDSYSQ